jgi:hypothetical protein
MFDKHLIQKATMAGSDQSTGSKMMHTVADSDKCVDKGYLTHLRSQGKVPASPSGIAQHASRMAHHRDWMKESKKVTEPVKHDDAMAGMRNLHKAMCPVIKGLNALVKSFETNVR